MQQNEHVAKFRDRPLDHEELMQRVFQEVTATGSYVYILADHETDQGRELDMENESFDLGTERLDAEEVAEGDGNTVDVDVGDNVATHVPSQVNDGGTPSYHRSMLRNPGQGSSGSKRKTPSTGTDEISQSMNRILRNMDTQKPFKTLCRTKHTMFEVTQILDEMEEFNTDPRPDVYWWFMEYLKENPVDADIFMAKSSEHARVEFVYHLHKKATLFARGEHDAFAPPPPWVPRSRRGAV